MSKLEKIKKVQAELLKLRAELNKYSKMYAEDGEVDTEEQKELDELQSVIDQAEEKLAQMEAKSSPPAPPSPVTPPPSQEKGNKEAAGPQAKSSGGGCDPDKVNEIREAYQAMIARARMLGQDVAADNLQHFVDGKGGTRNISVSWLRDFSSIEAAEGRILSNTEKSNLKKWVVDLVNGASASKTDYWDADITNYNPLSELSYASGASDMRGDVSMDLARQNDIVTITGNVVVVWSDSYDWNAGQSFDIPGFGNVSDDDGIYLKRCGGAADFMMRATWTFTYEGSYDAANDRWTKSEWKVNGTSYTPSDREIEVDSRN